MFRRANSDLLGRRSWYCRSIRASLESFHDNPLRSRIPLTTVYLATQSSWVDGDMGWVSSPVSTDPQRRSPPPPPAAPPMHSSPCSSAYLRARSKYSHWISRAVMVEPEANVSG